MGGGLAVPWNRWLWFLFWKRTLIFNLMAWLPETVAIGRKFVKALGII